MFSFLAHLTLPAYPTLVSWHRLHQFGHCKPLGLMCLQGVSLLESLGFLIGNGHGNHTSFYNANLNCTTAGKELLNYADKIVLK